MRGGIILAGNISVGGETLTRPLTLDDRRRLSGLSVAELARRTGVGYDRVWRYLCGAKLGHAEVKLLEQAIDSAERAR